MKKKRTQTEEIQNYILDQIETHPKDIVRITVEKFNISRQAVHRHIYILVKEGAIIQSGKTRNIQYELKPIAESKFSTPLGPGVEEDILWRRQILPHLTGIKPNVLGICRYGFTEMVNNAIDHSEGTELDISLTYKRNLISFMIADDGVGIFNKIQKKLSLDDPRFSILELAKGKFTTDDEKHSGQGVFYTSRMFDQFIILSGGLSFLHTEASNDWLFENQKNTDIGTAVFLSISPNSNRSSEQVFNQYSVDGDYGFSQTRVPVFLAEYGDENLISRSQAKRLLTRFDRFKKIILDFKKVDSIGQAFADEIFRVFQNDHPQIILETLNTSEQVAKMIARVKNEK
jgi:hypothetical protein